MVPFAAGTELACAGLDVELAGWLVWPPRQALLVELHGILKRVMEAAGAPKPAGFQCRQRGGSRVLIQPGQPVTTSVGISQMQVASQRFDTSRNSNSQMP